MSAIETVGAIVAIGLFAYLLVALFKPEKFQ
jgi:K+-transporting ATPase KdpF subunit